VSEYFFAPDLGEFTSTTGPPMWLSARRPPRFRCRDRLLTHLEIVVGLRLRRYESFYLSWNPHHRTGSGRQALWITAGVPTYVDLSGGWTPSVDRE